MKMTENKPQQRGNAMIYVLIALAMFGFLTMTLSRSNDQADGQDIDDEQAELYALDLIEYVASAQQVVDMMLISGSEIDDLDFVTPDDAAFNTPPHHHKVYHPQGGGLNYQAEFNKAIQITPSSGWFHSKLSNIEWTPTTALDVSLNALRIPEEICAIINKKITGNTTIPTMSASALSNFFSENSSNLEFNISDCTECNGKPSYCIQASGANGFFGFYNIIAAQ